MPPRKRTPTSRAPKPRGLPKAQPLDKQPGKPPRLSPIAPSSETDAFWIDADGPLERLVPIERVRLGGAGKWLLFVKRIDIDEVWSTIRAALEQGRLGHRAKVSTARPNPNSSNPEKHVICVYTTNANDESDIMRVREALRELGFTGKIAYKTDVATGQGLYQNRGKTKVSKYFL